MIHRKRNVVETSSDEEDSHPVKVVTDEFVSIPKKDSHGDVDSDQEDLPTGENVIRTLVEKEPIQESAPETDPVKTTAETGDKQMTMYSSDSDGDSSNESEEELEQDSVHTDLTKRDKLSLKRDMHMLLLKNQISLPTTKSKMNMGSFLQSRGQNRKIDDPLDLIAPSALGSIVSNIKADSRLFSQKTAFVIPNTKAPDQSTANSDSEAELEVIDLTKTHPTTVGASSNHSSKTLAVPLSRTERNRQLLKISEEQARQRREKIANERRQIAERKRRKDLLKAQKQKKADDLTNQVSEAEQKSQEHEAKTQLPAQPEKESDDHVASANGLSEGNDSLLIPQISLHYSQQDSEAEDNQAQETAHPSSDSDSTSNRESDDDNRSGDENTNERDDNSNTSGLDNLTKQASQTKKMVITEEEDDENPAVTAAAPLETPGSIVQEIAWAPDDSQSLLGLLSGTFESQEPLMPESCSKLEPTPMTSLKPLAQEDEELLALLSGNFSSSKPSNTSLHRDFLISKPSHLEPSQQQEPSTIPSSILNSTQDQFNTLFRVKVDKKIKRNAFVEGEAEVEEDEFMFLGGQDGDDDGFMNAEDVAMLDDDSEIEEGGDRILNLHQKQMKEKEQKEIADLLNDVTSGNLRKRMAKADGSGKGFDLYDSDEEDEALLRRIRAQHGFHVHKKSESDDEDGPTSLKKLAKNPETQAFAQCFDRGIQDKDGFISSDDEENGGTTQRNEIDPNLASDYKVIRDLVHRNDVTKRKGLSLAGKAKIVLSHDQLDEPLGKETCIEDEDRAIGDFYDESDDEDLMEASQSIMKTKKSNKAIIFDDDDENETCQSFILDLKESNRSQRRPFAEISQAIDEEETTISILRSYSQKRRKQSTRPSQNSSSLESSLLDITSVARSESLSRLMSKSSLSTLEIKPTSASIEGNNFKSINQRGMSFKSKLPPTAFSTDETVTKHETKSRPRMNSEMDEKSIALTRLLSRS